MPQNLRDLKPDTYGKLWLFKGMFATGKSPAGASFPGPIYFLDFDRRMTSLLKMFPNRTDIFYDTITGYKQYKNIIEGLCDECPYKTVVVDSLTNFVEMTMDYFIELRGGNSGTKPGDKEKKKGEISLLQIDDYSAETRALSELLINCKYIAETHKANVIIIAHVLAVTSTNIKTQTQTVEKYLVTYGKKGAAKIPTVIDEIYHFYSQASMSVGEDSAYLVNTDS